MCRHIATKSADVFPFTPGENGWKRDMHQEECEYEGKDAPRIWMGFVHEVLSVKSWNDCPGAT